jgi:Na+-driven multidrug efflux pump
MTLQSERVNYAKAFTIGILAAVAVFFLPRLLGAMFDDNDWKQLSGTADELLYVIIYPSWGKSIGLGATFGSVLLVAIGAAIAGYGLGFGTTGQLHFSFGRTDAAKAKNEAVLGIILLGVGLAISFLAWWLPADAAHQNTTYTVRSEDFDPRKAKKGQYDVHFHKYAQPDPIQDQAFPIQRPR